MEAPLPRALLIVSEEVRQKMEKLFDVAYMIAKLELPFTTRKNMECCWETLIKRTRPAKILSLPFLTS